MTNAGDKDDGLELDFEFLPDELEWDDIPTVDLSRPQKCGIFGSEEEPKNNDGRKTCYWCSSPTREYVGFDSRGNICERCNK